MRTHRSELLLAACLLSGCGTEIDADQSPVEMAAALSFEPLASEPGVVPDAAAPATTPLAGAPADAAYAPAAGLMATLYSENDVEVGARTDGVVRALHADLGDPVRAGAILAVLEDAVELAAVDAADAQLELMRGEHARVAALAAQGVMTPAELEQAVFRLRAAQATHDDARARLERTRVRAPFAGLVSRRFVRLGASVAEGEPLFRVTAMRPLRAQIRVPELAARHVARGDAVVLRSLDGREVNGRVSRVAPTVDPASGTGELLVDVPDPRGLPPGATVTARFPGNPR
ncbi:MAG TPA: efflux RND transporter periplasmic adaptor subunit [Longimicrobiales bacterium]|nr:efflux RND transporter periplasmic adaptor subunit [Longimicrobiales bacterium]